MAFKIYDNFFKILKLIIIMYLRVNEYFKRKTKCVYDKIEINYYINQLYFISHFSKVLNRVWKLEEIKKNQSNYIYKKGIYRSDLFINDSKCELWWSKDILVLTNITAFIVKGWKKLDFFCLLYKGIWWRWHPCGTGIDL